MDRDKPRPHEGSPYTFSSPQPGLSISWYKTPNNPLQAAFIMQISNPLIHGDWLWWLLVYIFISTSSESFQSLCLEYWKGIVQIIPASGYTQLVSVCCLRPLQYCNNNFIPLTPATAVICSAPPHATHFPSKAVNGTSRNTMPGEGPLNEIAYSLLALSTEVPLTTLFSSHPSSLSSVPQNFLIERVFAVNRRQTFNKIKSSWKFLILATESSVLIHQDCL